MELYTTDISLEMDMPNLESFPVPQTKCASCLSLLSLTHAQVLLSHHLPLVPVLLRGSLHQPITALYREFPHRRPRPPFDAESASQAMPPAALGKDSWQCHSTARQASVRQCESRGRKRENERDGL